MSASDVTLWGHIYMIQQWHNYFDSQPGLPYNLTKICRFFFTYCIYLYIYIYMQNRFFFWNKIAMGKSLVVRHVKAINTYMYMYYMNSVLVQDFVSGQACCVNQYHYQLWQARLVPSYLQALNTNYKQTKEIYSIYIWLQSSH
jgi:hypothetical protein